MKCQSCEKTSTYHITEIVDGGVREVHLCEECAREYLAQSQPEQDSPAVGNLASVLAQQLAVGETAEELTRLEQKSCPQCGITFLEFRKHGRLGCPHDYEVFFEELEPLILNIHGELQHTGKVPARASHGSRRQTELMRLRRELQQAIGVENYEEASRIRDQIETVEAEPAEEEPTAAVTPDKPAKKSKGPKKKPKKQESDD